MEGIPSPTIILRLHDTVCVVAVLLSLIGPETIINCVLRAGGRKRQTMSEKTLVGIKVSLY